jgi:hypothetical protein
MGLTVFPDTRTGWHFDDKVAQKYLLEAVGAPLVPTHLFYEERLALEWAARADFPKVFKLRRGGGSANVRLVPDRRSAEALVRRAFRRGFNPVAGYQQDARKRFRASRRRGDLLNAIRRLPATLARIRRLNTGLGRERGYVYFQDFMPANHFDTRVTIIGRRAFAFTRNVRPNDSRASGSGDIVYDTGRIDRECVRIAFTVAAAIGAQSLAFDFVKAPDGRPLIVEMSYCYDPAAVHACPGHWDVTGAWHDGQVWPQDAILADLLESIDRKRGRSASGETTTPALVDSESADLRDPAAIHS